MAEALADVLERARAALAALHDLDLDEVSGDALSDAVLAMQHLVRRIPAPPALVRAAVSLVRSTRPGESDAPALARSYLSWGAGPRAVQNLILGGKARALLYGRAHVQCDDIQALAKPVLRHRILTNFTAASEGVTTDAVVDRLLKETPAREGELQKDERFKKIFAS